MRIKKIISELDPYIPGKSQDEIVKRFNLKKEDIIKMGSNENPWGSSEKAIEEVKKNVSNIFRYPESNLNELTEEVAKYSKVAPEQIIIGGDGADEIIDILAKTFIDSGDEFIVHQPTYTYYEFLFKPYGAIPVYASWDLDKNVLDTKSVLDKITEKTKMIFLCSPNNPTGGLIPKEDIIKISESTDALIVVDEAYTEYAETDNVDLLENYNNIFIMRTMSKVLGLAGMRVGYGLSNTEVIEYMHRVKPVFSLTRLSYIAALNTLKDTDYIETSTKNGIKSREYLYTELSKIKAFNVFKSKSNYILVGIKDTGKTAKELSTLLLEKGVIVRDCTSFKGLDEYWIRISIGTFEEDEKFIKIINEVLKESC